MKKFFYLLISCLFVTTVNAQVRVSEPSAPNHFKNDSPVEKYLFKNKAVNATYHLSDRISTDRYELKHFTYDQNERVIAVKDSSGDPQYGFLMVIDSITYNEQNLVSRIDGYQLLDGVWKHVYYVNYRYDADGNMIERTNFNSFGSESFSQGGVYDYIYENGRLVRHDMYFGDHATIAEQCFYQYDAQNHLISEISLQGFGVLDSSLRTNYTYDANGRLSSLQIFIYEPDLYVWDTDNSEYFLYDDAGNCIEHSVKNRLGMYTDRRFYDYHATITSDQVSMPYYVPELSYPEAYDDANMRILEHWFTLDVNYDLQYVCDFQYLYDGQEMSVEDLPMAQSSVYPNPTDGLLHIRNDQQNVKNIMLYDVFGKLLLSESVNDASGVVNMSQYPSGVYLLKMTLEDGRTDVQKIMKR